MDNNKTHSYIHRGRIGAVTAIAFVVGYVLVVSFFLRMSSGGVTPLLSLLFAPGTTSDPPASASIAYKVISYPTFVAGILLQVIALVNYWIRE
jgi:hypothetical protein